MDSHRGSMPSLPRLVICVALALVLVAVDLWLGLEYDTRPRPFLASDIALGVCFAAAGIAAWRLRPRSRTGVWMLGLGYVILAENPNGFTVPKSFSGYLVIMVFGGMLYWLQFAFGCQLLLSYPSGRLPHGSPERHLVLCCFALAVAGGTAVQALQATTGTDPGPYVAVRTGIMTAWIVLAAIAAGLIGRRTIRSSSHQRRQDGFGLAAATAAIGLFIVMFIVLLAIYGAAANTNTSTVLNVGVAWTAIFAVPIVFFIGLLRERLAFAAVGDLVGRLENVGAGRIEAALSETLRDPTLRVAFPTPDGLLDVSGRRCDAPPGEDRALTPLGEPPFAVLVHDPVLLEGRELLDAAASAARLALDNARLYAEVRAQLSEVQASRQRIAAAADTERRRLERDLHDGAQQRLLGIGFILGALRTRTDDPALREMLHEVETELRTTIAELRDFAQGIRPAILTDQGLAPALAGLTRRAHVRVSLSLRLAGRLDPVIESTAYYVVSEALQNVAKHTEDARACVSAVHGDGRLIIEVCDDGPGGASMKTGTGLRGLADRVNAVGGRFEVTSSPGDGTTIRAELPCA